MCLANLKPVIAFRSRKAKPLEECRGRVNREAKFGGQVRNPNPVHSEPVFVSGRKYKQDHELDGSSSPVNECFQNP